MPGISGFVKFQNQFSKKALKASLDKLTYHDWYIRDSVFEDENIICSRVHLGMVGDLKSPFENDGIYGWVEGEFYNLDEFKKEIPNPKSNTDFLILAYQKGILENILLKTDGYFSAVLYDSKKKRIFLISDRLGFKNLFYGFQNNHFSWSSELKGFLDFPDFEPKISGNAIGCFLNLGYFIGDLTWFEGVHLLDAATILIFDLNQNKIIQKKRYWTWAKIQKQKIGFEEAPERLSELIVRAVRKRSENVKDFQNLSHFKSPKSGITLSGGLDSRAILAAQKNPQYLRAVTYGKQNCDDIKIARQVTEITQTPHTILDLNEQNWLENRLESVWRTDGMLGFNHLHFGVWYEKIKSLFDINLNGILGELALGGALIKRPNHRISKKTTRKVFGKFADLISVEDAFYDFESEDVFWIDTRTRRFVHGGSIDFSKTTEQRNPFADNELLEFVYSLPDDFRLYSRLFIRALLCTSLPPKGEPPPAPEAAGGGSSLGGRGAQSVFTIPWQKTGLPPSQIRKTILFKKLKIPQIKNRLGLWQSQHFTDYPNWFRTEEATKLFSEILNSKNAIYPNYVNEEPVCRRAGFEKKYLEPHLKRKRNFTEMISRTVTLEWWLRQVFR